MTEIILILLVVVGVFFIISFLTKIIGYSFKAHKNGYLTYGIVVGYTNYYDLDLLLFYPIVKIDDEIIKSNVPLTFPVYKINEKVKVEYYKDGYNYKNKEVFINRFLGKKEEMRINTSSKINIKSFKNILDIFIELFITIILCYLKFTIK